MGEEDKSDEGGTMPSDTVSDTSPTSPTSPSSVKSFILQTPIGDHVDGILTVEEGFFDIKEDGDVGKHGTAAGERVDRSASIPCGTGVEGGKDVDIDGGDHREGGTAVRSEGDSCVDIQAGTDAVGGVEGAMGDTPHCGDDSNSGKGDAVPPDGASVCDTVLEDGDKGSVGDSIDSRSGGGSPVPPAGAIVGESIPGDGDKAAVGESIDGKSGSTRLREQQAAAIVSSELIKVSLLEAIVRKSHSADGDRGIGEVISGVGSAGVGDRPGQNNPATKEKSMTSTGRDEGDGMEEDERLRKKLDPVLPSEEDKSNVQEPISPDLDLIKLETPATDVKKSIDAVPAPDATAPLPSTPDSSCNSAPSTTIDAPPISDPATTNTTSTTKRQAPRLIIDIVPAASRRDQLRSSNKRKGRYPALAGWKSVSKSTSDDPASAEEMDQSRVFEMHVPPTGMELEDIRAFRLKFQEYIGSGSLSDGFKARLTIERYGAGDEAVDGAVDGAASEQKDAKDGEDGEASQGLRESTDGAGAEGNGVQQVDNAESDSGDTRRKTPDVAGAADDVSLVSESLDIVDDNGQVKDDVSESPSVAVLPETFDVVVKLVRPQHCQRTSYGRSPKDYIKSVQAEAKLYAGPLVPLQGKVVPRFYGMWTNKHHDSQSDTPQIDCCLTVLEYVGKEYKLSGPRTDERIAVEAERILGAHRQLHSVGVLHDSVSHKMEHFRVDEAGRIRVIDFEKSQDINMSSRTYLSKAYSAGSEMLDLISFLQKYL